MKIGFLTLLALVIYSCQQKSKNNLIYDNGEVIVETKQSLINNNSLEVVLDVLVTENDRFEIFYTNDSINEPFKISKSIYSELVGSEDFQTLTFIFPKGVMPYNFRIDIGDNQLRKESKVEIKTVTLKLNNKSIIINRQILDHFFIANDYLEKTSLGYLRHIINNKYDPYLLASPVLLAKMNIEF